VGSRARRQHQGHLLLHPGSGQADDPAEARAHYHHRLGQRGSTQLSPRVAQGPPLNSNCGGGRIATAAYTASKGAVVALTRNVARDLLGTGIGVNCVNPGPIDSPMHAPLTAEQRARVTGSIPLGWMAKPEEIANGVLFLASGRAASFMYGTNLNIDGGTQMGAS